MKQLFAVFSYNYFYITAIKLKAQKIKDFKIAFT